MVSNFYCTVLYIATKLHLTAEPLGRPVALSMYIYTGIAVDEIGRMICSHRLEYNNHRSIIFYIKLLCVHDAMTCNIVAIL